MNGQIGWWCTGCNQRIARFNQDAVFGVRPANDCQQKPGAKLLPVFAVLNEDERFPAASEPTLGDRLRGRKKASR